MHRTFEEICSLAPGEQRALFESGDPPTRLHAAWAIALTIGRDTVPMLKAATVGDVPEGLRQQFIVMLAGLHERALLKTIALTDASISVRSTALRYFVRTAIEQDAELDELIGSQLAAGDPDLKLALLEEYDAGRAILTDEQIIALLADNADAVQRAAVAAVLGTPAVSDAVREALVHRLLRAERRARVELIAELGRGEVHRIVRALANVESSDATQILHAVVGHFGPLPWAELAALAGTSDPSLVIGILSSLQMPLAAEGLAWVEHVCVLAVESGDTAVRQATSGVLVKALSASPSAVLQAHTKQVLLGQIDADIVSAKAAIEDPWSDDDHFDDNFEWLEHLEGLGERLRE